MSKKRPHRVNASLTKAASPERTRSVQVESPVALTQAASGIASSGWSVWSFLSAMDECPPYWSRARDTWLRNFVYRPGNDLLAGVMATAVNKCVATGFVLEGPERTANLYRDIILRRSEFGKGYAKMMGKDAFDFFSQDSGAFRERIRISETDVRGAAMGFAHLDAQRCYTTGQTEYPVEYVDVEGTVHRVHYSQVQRYTDLTSPQETLYDIGFCSVSRAVTTAHILVDIARYKRERLSDLPPAGLLMLNNMTEIQWQDMETKYSVQERNKGNSTWRNVMVAFGLDPALPLSAELFEFSRLPESFNEPEAIKISVLSLALAFNMDVEEIWSILGGQMGSAREADVQHMKARAKGPGAFLTETERGWNDGLTIPTSITFRYDFQDAEEDELAAKIEGEKATTIRKLWEPSQTTGAGIITTDEARQWLQLEGIVSDELMTLGSSADEMTADDTEMAKAWSIIKVDDSPRCKAYSDGRIIRLEKRPQMWAGVALSMMNAARVKSESDSRLDQLLAKFEMAMFDFRVAMKSQPESLQQLPREIVLRAEGGLMPQTNISIDKVVAQPPVVNVSVEPTPVNVIVNVPKAEPPVINIEPTPINMPEAKAAVFSPVINIEPTPVTIENQVIMPTQPIDLSVNVAGTTTVVKRNAMGQILELENTPKVEVKK